MQVRIAFGMAVTDLVLGIRPEGFLQRQRDIGDMILALLPNTLSAFSQYFWIREQGSSNGICFWGEGKGFIEEDALRDALRSVQRRYPLLRASIVKRPGEMPQFVENQRSIELSVSASEGDASLSCVIRREMLRGSAESLFRVVFLRHSPENFTLLFVINHAVSDAQGADLIMRDLLRALSGERLVMPSGEIITHEDVLGQPSLVGYSQTLTETPTG